MDHADVLARLADAAASPRGLDLLAADGSADATAVHEHLEDCADCRRELVAWQRTSAALLDATPDALTAPAEARERILRAVVRDGVPRGAAATARVEPAPQGVPQRRSMPPGASVLPASAPVAPPASIGRPPVASTPLHRDEPANAPVVIGSRTQGRGASPVRLRRLALAAAAVLIIFVAGAVLGTPLGLTPRDHGVAALLSAVAASDRILQQPEHREAVLTRADGTKAGSVLVDPMTGDIVVLSSELDATDPSDYHCNLVRDGGPAMWIGPMFSQDGTAYWAGQVTTVADLGRTGDVIQVMDGGSAPDLSATF